TFGIHIHKHIFGIATGGAAVMKKLCRIANIPHQECLAHSIHLGVRDSILQQSGDNRKIQTLRAITKKTWRMKL
ncbi:MAG: hypothetical protein MHPSP_003731, partial [Paramarteilia canceri]